jgi:hypothetical protein
MISACLVSCVSMSRRLYLLPDISFREESSFDVKFNHHAEIKSPAGQDRASTLGPADRRKTDIPIASLILYA